MTEEGKKKTSKDEMKAKRAAKNEANQDGSEGFGSSNTVGNKAGSPTGPTTPREAATINSNGKRKEE